MSKLDLTGQTFGRLTVLREAKKKGEHRYWVCRCSCNTIKEIGQSNLRAGKSTSCGCYATELAGKTYKDKFVTHGDHGARLYRIHRGMLNRCNHSWDTNYSRYGAVGVKVSPLWQDYIAFKLWALSAGYTELLTLDRIDSSGDYTPENCRWVTYEIQTRNRRKQSKPASSKYIGVSLDRALNKWVAAISVSGTLHRLGYFDTEYAAAKARDSYIQEHSLEGFKLNF